MKVNLTGVVIDNDDKWFYELFEMDSFAPKDLDEALASGEDLEIDINSVGGSVYAGAEIYTKLMAYQHKVTANVVGLAASAASVIAMAGDAVNISPVGQIMIHNVSSVGTGDYHDMDKMSETLKKSNESLANAYVAKTGMAKTQVLDLMDKETWITAEQAVDLGFADSIMEKVDEELELVASLKSPLPKAVITKFKELMDKNKQLEKNLVTINVDEKMVQNIVDDTIKKYEQGSESESKGFRAFAF